MSNEKLSIIIPCYNCAGTLAEAVTSCYEQGFSIGDFEIVLTDDCSTDETSTVISSLSRTHPNIRTFSHESNKGGGATRNTCVTHAKFDAIFCLDSDDILPSGTLRLTLDFMNKKHCDAVGIHHSLKFSGNDSTHSVHTDTFDLQERPITIIDLLQQKESTCSLYSTFMFTKQAFTKAGGYPTVHGFDTQGFAWRFIASGGTAYTCPNASYLHRVNYHESYYLREYNAGKSNFNWQDIFLEHIDVFTPEAQQFIRDFNCSDFTQNIMDELKKLPHSIRADYHRATHHLPKTEEARLPHHYVSRNSLMGIYFRIKARMRTALNRMTV